MRSRHIYTERGLLGAGILWFSLGTVVFFSKTATYLTIVKYSGVVLLVDGLLQLLLSFQTSHSRIRNWRIAESVVDIAFSSILLLDPVFSLFAFPFLLTPWMGVKGTIRMIGSALIAKGIRRWKGDFLGGMLLLAFSILIPHDPIEKPYGIALLTAILGWTLGLIYFYDLSCVYRSTDHNQYPA